MKTKKINLCLFGGEGAAPAAAGTGDASAASESTAKEGSAAGSMTDGTTETVTPPEVGAPETPHDDGAESEKERRARFDEMLRGEYKDLFNERMQKIIDKRFAKTKGLEEKVAGQEELISRLAERYGTSDAAELADAIDKDDALWKSAADASDMSVEQYRSYQNMARENARLRAEHTEAVARKNAEARLAGWQREGEAVKAKYPSFSFEAELANEEFAKMLRAGVSVSAAYQALHHDEILADAASRAASDAERRITENIRARGERPAENGTGAGAGVIAKKDVSKLTRAERADIARRAMLGGKIEF